MQRYIIAHRDEHGELHQLTGTFEGKTPEDALYTLWEQSGSDANDDGWEVWPVTDESEIIP